MNCPDHPKYKAGHCLACVAAAVPMPEGFKAPRPARPVVRTKPQPGPADLRQARERADAEVGM